jgi:GNAT superfamily N-acetyltransferase
MADTTRRRKNPGDRRLDLDRIQMRPATPGRWKDIETLFGERGACGGCWCMAWRLPRGKWLAGKPKNGAANKRAFKRIVARNEQPGVLAYLGREPIGWCAVAPRERYPALERSRVLQPVDDQPVWSITCLFVFKPYRRHGVSARLLDAAAELAARKGARIVEGYPIEPTMKKTPDPFLWLGTPAAFRRAAFEEVARRSKSRPIMRRVLPGK